MGIPGNDGRDRSIPVEPEQVCGRKKEEERNHGNKENEEDLDIHIYVLFLIESSADHQGGINNLQIADTNLTKP